MAQNNIKMRKQRELMEEVFKIAKGVVHGGRGNQSFIKKLNEKLIGKQLPNHVKKVLFFL